MSGNDNFKKTLLQQGASFIKKHGLQLTTEDSLLKALDVSKASFRTIATDVDDFIEQALKYDLEEQRETQKSIIDNAPNAIYALMSLLANSFKELKEIGPAYMSDVYTNKKMWARAQEDINNYSVPLYYNLLNRGIQEGILRKDINLDIVTKVIMENVRLLIDKSIFPPEKYAPGEVLRCVYLYYFRGLCDESGFKHVDNFFANNNNTLN